MVSVWARTIFAMLPQAIGPMPRATSTGRGKVLGTMASSASDMITSGIVTMMPVARLNS